MGNLAVTSARNFGRFYHLRELNPSVIVSTGKMFTSQERGDMDAQDQSDIDMATYAKLTREFWSGEVPDYDEVTVTVRRAGRVQRFVLLTRDGATTLDRPSCSPVDPAA